MEVDFVIPGSGGDLVARVLHIAEESDILTETIHVERVRIEECAADPILFGGAARSRRFNSELRCGLLIERLIARHCALGDCLVAALDLDHALLEQLAEDAGGVEPL